MVSHNLMKHKRVNKQASRALNILTHETPLRALPLRGNRIGPDVAHRMKSDYQVVPNIADAERP